MLAKSSRSSREPGRRDNLRCSVIRLELPASLTYRGVALQVVAATCETIAAEVKRLHRSDGIDFTEQVVSAVGEAFNNTVLHAYQGGTDGRVIIELEIGSNALLIRIIDSGASFDLGAVPDTELEGVRESGMGVFIMRAFMDEVAYEPGPPNVLSLRKLL
jgi:serine/threonine-protein kinase RsbW